MKIVWLVLLLTQLARGDPAEPLVDPKPIELDAGVPPEKQAAPDASPVQPQPENAQRKTRAAITAFNKETKASVEENARLIEHSKRQFLGLFQRDLPIDRLADLVQESDFGLPARAPN